MSRAYIFQHQSICAIQNSCWLLAPGSWFLAAGLALLRDEDQLKKLRTSTRTMRPIEPSSSSPCSYSSSRTQTTKYPQLATGYWSRASASSKQREASSQSVKPLNSDSSICKTLSRYVKYCKNFTIYLFLTLSTLVKPFVLRQPKLFIFRYLVTIANGLQWVIHFTRECKALLIFLPLLPI